MGWEIVVATIVGGFFSTLTLLLWQKGTWKKMELEQQYNIRRFKLGKKYKLLEQELPKQTKKSWLEMLKDIDKNKIETILDMLQGGGEEEEESPIDAILSEHPEVADTVKSVVQSILKPEKKEDQTKDDVLRQIYFEK